MVNFWCKGHKAIAAMAVVQFGFAISNLSGPRWRLSESPYGRGQPTVDADPSQFGHWSKAAEVKGFPFIASALTSGMTRGMS